MLQLCPHTYFTMVQEGQFRERKGGINGDNGWRVTSVFLQK